jgi:microcin C transport system permease protein
MSAYVLRRLLLMIPTIFGIMVISFLVVQFAPGGPVEQAIATLQGMNVDPTARLSGAGDFVGAGPEAGNDAAEDATSRYRGAQGLSPLVIEKIEKQFGFDKPPHERFLLMLWNYLRFDFGESYFRGVGVLELIASKMPVSISLGLWMTLLTYLISIPLGIRKAIKDGSRFDVWTSGVIIIGYAVPGFLFAVLLIILFSGGNHFALGLTIGGQFYGINFGCACFPLRGLVSPNWGDLTWPERILDYFWHLTLPLAAMAIGTFATLTLLTKNSFLDEIRKQYVMTARAKGLAERTVLYRHVFRNAMLIVVASFPGAFVGVFFAGSLLIETIFSLDGLGLLGFQSVLNRDYAVVFATLYIFSLMGLVLHLITDLAYMWIDPRIDFETRQV